MNIWITFENWRPLSTASIFSLLVIRVIILDSYYFNKVAMYYSIRNGTVWIIAYAWFILYFSSFDRILQYLKSFLYTYCIFAFLNDTFMYTSMLKWLIFLHKMSYKIFRCSLKNTIYLMEQQKCLRMHLLYIICLIWI